LNQKTKRLFVFGNKHLKNDSFAVQVGQRIKETRKDIDVVHCQSPFALLEFSQEEMAILDVVANADRPTLIEDVSRIKTSNLVSLHDFDLGFFLSLMREMGTAKKIKIIGVPRHGNIEEVAKEVEKWL